MFKNHIDITSKITKYKIIWNFFYKTETKLDMDQPKTEVDIYRDSPLRYLGFYTFKNWFFLKIT